MSVLLQNDKFIRAPVLLESLFIPDCSLDLHESEEAIDDEDLSDGCLNQRAKKRRLTTSQVELLEKNFEAEKKLDPQRKIKLAEESGLEPRQVAIWFQNRRAKFKNKELEKEFNYLKAKLDKLKDDCDKILKENENLRNEVDSLEEKLLIQAEGKESLYEPLDAMNSSNQGHDETQIAAKLTSDVLNSGSPDGTNGTEAEDNDDHLRKWFPKLENDCRSGPPANSCSSLGLLVDDPPPSWSWFY